MENRALLAWIVAGALGLVAWMLGTLQTWAAGRFILHSEYSWLDALLYNFVLALFWLFGGRLILEISVRFPLAAGRWRRALLAHVLACLLFAGAFLVVCSLWAAGYPEPQPQPFLSHLARMSFYSTLFQDSIFAYWLLVGLAHAYDYYWRFRERELRAARLETSLAEARIQALRMQLQPHFLFNTLNAVSTMALKNDSRAAADMLSRLGDFLRMTLEESGAQEIPLRRELSFVEKYLAIEKVRLGERLGVELEIEVEALDAVVPNLLLQPLVENAVRHGIALREGGGRLRIAAARSGAVLRIELWNDVPVQGRPVQDRARAGAVEFFSGLGIANVRSRLEQAYGEGQRFEAAPTADDGFRARIELPWKVAQPPSPRHLA